MTNPEPWQTRTPDLAADVRLYPTENGGRSIPAMLGWGCPCFTSKDTEQGGYGMLVCSSERNLSLRELSVALGSFFLSPEGAETMKRAGHFYLWEGRFIGEAQVVSD